MSLTLLVDVIDSVYRIAVVSKNELIYLDADRITPHASLDSIYYARVSDINSGYLSWDLCPGVSATSRVEKSFPPLTVGQWARVQVVREGFVEVLGPQIIQKPIEVSQNLTFVQESVIFQPYGQGWIKRTGKEINPQHQILVQDEFAALKDNQTPGLLMLGPTSLERLLRDQPFGPIDAIELGNSDGVSYGRQGCVKYAPSLLSKMKIKQSSPTLLEDWGYADRWQDTLNMVIDLARGVRLIIQTTAVATTIDINAGALEEDEINLKICPLLAQQLIWRRLSGRVLIDFAGVQNNAHKRRRLMEELKARLMGDSPKWHILGWSPCGLLELQRERRRMSLEQVVGF